MPQTVVHDAYEVFAGGPGSARVLLTCEHASNRMPPGWEWPEQDQWLVQTHWAIDLGIAEITRDLAEALQATAVLARFTRLLVDPNRPLDSETLFRTHAEGRPVVLNQGLDAAERARRLDRLYTPYHAAIRDKLSRYPGPLVLSLHSFTPVYEGGPPRAMEVGVLFDREEALAANAAPVIARHGLKVALNEPYTGKGGLMYSPQHHADHSGRRALEIEIRQDCAADPLFRARVVAALVDMTEAVLAEIDQQSA